jgi:hypothetical protein
MFMTLTDTDAAGCGVSRVADDIVARFSLLPLHSTCCLLLLQLLMLLLLMCSLMYVADVRVRASGKPGRQTLDANVDHLNYPRRAELSRMHHALLRNWDLLTT